MYALYLIIVSLNISSLSTLSEQFFSYSTHFGKKTSNYFSRIKERVHDCEISSTHFIEHHRDTWISDYGRNSDFEYRGIHYNIG